MCFGDAHGYSLILWYFTDKFCCLGADSSCLGVQAGELVFAQLLWVWAPERWATQPHHGSRGPQEQHLCLPQLWRLLPSLLQKWSRVLITSSRGSIASHTAPRHAPVGRVNRLRRWHRLHLWAWSCARAGSRWTVASYATFHPAHVFRCPHPTSLAKFKFKDKMISRQDSRASNQA